MKTTLLIITALLAAATIRATDDFRILIDRTELKENLITGTISLNDVPIGNTYENNDVKITPGMYKGLMRYSSSRNFVQGPGGIMGQEGDFLLEASGVRGPTGESRTAILLHGGNKAHHSQGCILLGPVGRSSIGQAEITKEHPLYKLRLAFYGTDTPDATPYKNITIEIRDSVPRLEGIWLGEGGGYNGWRWTFRPGGTFLETSRDGRGPWPGKWTLNDGKFTVTMDKGPGRAAGTLERNVLRGRNAAGKEFLFRRQN